MATKKVTRRKTTAAKPQHNPHGTARYESVSADEAIARAKRREKGELPPIEHKAPLLPNKIDVNYDPFNDGTQLPKDVDISAASLGSLMDSLPTHEEVAAKKRKLEENVQHDKDAENLAGIRKLLALASQMGEEFAINSEGTEVIDKLSEYRDVAPAALVEEHTVVQQSPIPKHTKRVALSLVDGTMTLPTINIINTQYSVTLFIELKDDAMTFIPKPGTELSIIVDGVETPCYFPGTFFEWEEINLMGLVFVKATEAEE
jgi:hypothetical protein